MTQNVEETVKILIAQTEQLQILKESAYLLHYFGRLVEYAWSWRFLD